MCACFHVCVHVSHVFLCVHVCILMVFYIRVCAYPKVYFLWLSALIFLVQSCSKENIVQRIQVFVDSHVEEWLQEVEPKEFLSEYPKQAIELKVWYCMWDEWGWQEGWEGWEGEGEVDGSEGNGSGEVGELGVRARQKWGGGVSKWELKEWPGGGERPGGGVNGCR